MRYIAAPWRERYVRSAAAARGCIFCRALKDGDDRASLVLDRGRHAFVLLNRYPYTPGHLMIAPRRHTADPAAAGPAVTAEIAALIQRSLRILRRTHRPQGFNIGLNLGRSAGAGVADHYHVHVVCRWTGDANFMPLVGGTRVFIEDLAATYDRLSPEFARARRRSGARRAAGRSLAQR